MCVPHEASNNKGRAESKYWPFILRQLEGKWRVEAGHGKGGSSGGVGRRSRDTVWCIGEGEGEGEDEGRSRDNALGRDGKRNA